MCWKAGPAARWEDELAEFAQKHLGGKGRWILLAACKEAWRKEEGGKEHWTLLGACKEAWRKEEKKFAKEVPEQGDEEEEGD